MSSVQGRAGDLAASDRVASPAVGSRQGSGRLRVEAALAAAAFAAMCLAVLLVRPQVAEPDDGAYHHSIVAITMGHFGTLSSTQLDALQAKLGNPSGRPVPNQWVELASGRYLSEKDPGYPYLAAPFQELGIIRWAPLFFGAVACIGLFIGARRWLGQFAGLAAVGLFCTSGAALAFAWRDYMPTFTDASLIAAGSGALLWAMLATEASRRRRTWAGLAGFVAIEVATFVRYSNIVILGCAVITVIVARQMKVAKLATQTVLVWLASAIAFGLGVAIFDDVVYGAPLKTGYQPGEVTFSLRAVGTNLRIMPRHLIQAMPMLILALVALGWITARAIREGHSRGAAAAVARRDAWVALALALPWMAIWALYATYTWTTDPTSVTVQVVRFYLPALGSISLLGAWLVTRLPRNAWARGLASTVAVGGLLALGVWAFHAMYAAYGVPLSG